MVAGHGPTATATVARPGARCTVQSAPMSHQLVVMKFGGSSVANADRIRRVARRVAAARADGADLCVVVSAMGDTTDELLSLAAAITEEPDPRELDISSPPARTRARPSWRWPSTPSACRRSPSPAPRPGSSPTGPTARPASPASTPSGSGPTGRREGRHRGGLPGPEREGRRADGDDHPRRGGSDTTAVALAAALRGGRCQVYTDVKGIYTADPRLVPDARQLQVIGYEEMLELATRAPRCCRCGPSSSAGSTTS